MKIRVKTSSINQNNVQLLTDLGFVWLDDRAICDDVFSYFFAPVIPFTGENVRLLSELKALGFVVDEVYNLPDE